MDLSQLFAPRHPLAEIDDIIGEDMNAAHKAAVEKDGLFGSVTFKADTLDQLLAFADSPEREDGNCSLQGFLLRKMARILYDGGEEQQYADIVCLHRDTRALLEISKEMESSYSWRKAGYDSAIALAKRYGLNVRAGAIEAHLALADKYQVLIRELQKECPCYNMALMEKNGFNDPDERPVTGQPMLPREEPLVEA